ncbi:hypothetical protein [Cupriavidus basilensis]|uniref:hypothetical protein n=1 Tax=Cupriavidus basilensis TaxID=68895 RepID=UPI00075149F6|nr:hypothetical protein [Cupriavidus basilensis]
MSSYSIIIDATFEGPAESTLEGSLHIEFTAVSADSLTGAAAGVVIDKVRIQIGGAWHEFNGDLQSDWLLFQCHRYLETVREEVFYELSDRARMDAKDRAAEMRGT